MKIISVALLALGLISASFSSILISWGEQDLSINQVVFGRLWITVLVYGLYGLVIRLRASMKCDKFEIRLKWWGWWSKLKEERFTIVSIFFLGLCFYANQIVWSWSIENTSIANSTVLHNLTPIFTATGAFLWLDQYFSKVFVLGILISIAGAISLEIEVFSFEFSHLLGDLAAIASAAFYSAYLLILEQLKGKVDLINIVFFYCLAGALFSLLVLVAQGDDLFPHSMRGWSAVLLLALVCQTLGQALIAFGIQRFSSSTVSLAHLLCPCMSAIEAWLIFGERLAVANIIGFSTILVGLFVSSIGGNLLGSRGAMTESAENQGKA